MAFIINLNPAIDRIYTITNFQIGEIHRSHLQKAQAGGKGINVARAAKILGHESIVFGFLGGYSGQFIQNDLEKAGISHQFTWIEKENRTCLVILDSTKNTQTVINEEGPYITEKEYDSFFQLQNSFADHNAIIVMSGSLPTNIPPHVYRNLVQLYHSHHRITMVDASREALCQAIQSPVSILKANVFEFAEIAPQQNLTSITIENLSSFYPYMRSLLQKGCQNIILTLGEKGAIWWNEKHIFFAKPPLVHAVNTVGSGDSMTAAIACELEKQKIMSLDQFSSFNIPKALIAGVSAGTANALVGGIQFSKAMFEELYHKVTLFQLDW